MTARDRAVLELHQALERYVTIVEALRDADDAVTAAMARCRELNNVAELSAATR